ncbi:uncharacterized protein LOC107458400 [Arachis duranensis]|uniref:Uncharacterized protein LOC107458400 n=1 Tax=Arachis duranensis TaxID=130453 RepID=A0A6P4B4M1_ARADU|nr:uncharacterized protein LOC107458400 [Arachis duranensis]
MSQRQAQDFSMKEYDVIVNERKIYRAMVKAKERIKGSEIAYYALLRDYSNEVIRTNPGSIVRVSTDYVEGTGHKFKRIYICLEGCKKGFSVDCRPFIGLDGTFLKKILEDTELKMAMWRCAMATTSQEFTIVIDRITLINPHAWEHACVALSYQNRKPEEHSHNWLSMGAYNSKYQFVIHPVLSQEYWQHIDLPPILPPIYKKQIGRPKLKRDKKNDRPKESTPNLHRAPKKYGPIICKYCLKTRHNSRSCSKKNETMAGSAGEQTSSQHPSTGGATVDDKEETTRLEEMF